MVKLITAALGATLTCYGIYKVASGFFDLYDSSYDHTEKACQDRLYQAKESIIACPEAKELWESVQAMGPFTIQCDSFDDSPRNQEFGATANQGTREIRIYTKYLDVLRGVVFELANLLTAKPGGVQCIDRMCRLSPEQYALEVEKEEYESEKIFVDVFAGCIKRGIWRPTWGIVQRTFEETLKAVKSTGHYDSCIKSWYETCKPR